MGRPRAIEQHCSDYIRCSQRTKNVLLPAAAHAAAGELGAAVPQGVLIKHVVNEYLRLTRCVCLGPEHADLLKACRKEYLRYHSGDVGDAELLRAVMQHYVLSDPR